MSRSALLALLLSGFLSGPASAAEKKERVDRLVGATVLGVRISVDTFRTIQTRLGPSEIRRWQKVGNESPASICYRTPSRKTWVWFQSNGGGIDDPIDTIVMASHPRRADEECTLVGEDADQEGIRKLKLGMTEKEVTRWLGKRACSENQCHLTETRRVSPSEYDGADELTLSVIAALKFDRVDSLTLWRVERSPRAPQEEP